MNKLNKLYLNTVTYIFVVFTALISLLLNIKLDTTHPYQVTLNSNNLAYVCGVDERFIGEQIILIDSSKYKIEVIMFSDDCFSLEDIKTIDFRETNYIEIIEQNSNLMAYILNNLI